MNDFVHEEMTSQEFDALNKFLFERSYDNSNKNWIIKTYFDLMYNDGDFLRAIELFSQQGALNTDGAYCHFSVNNPYYDEPFEGVQFAIGYPPTEEDTIVVSEAVCYEYVRLACQKYLQRHPEDTEKINELLAKMPM